jgi:hypothetical protein
MNIIAAAAGVQAFFHIPAGMAGSFTVLSWDGAGWAEVALSVVGGEVAFTATGTGTFMLVTR